MKNTFVFAMALLALTACGESSSGQKAKIISLCHQELNMPGEICECIGEESQTVLMSDDERAMVIAMISKDEETSEKLRTTIPVDGMMRAGMFMVNAPNNCAKKMGAAQ